MANEDTTLANAGTAEGAEAVVSTEAIAGAEGGTKESVEGTQATEGSEGSEAEQKAAADKAAADKVAEGAPEAYEDFKMPEGMELDTVALEAAAPVFKDLNLTQDQAQKLIDLQAASMQKAGETQQEAWTKTVTDWATETKENKEYGGEHLNENLALAKSALDKLGTPELRELVDSTGIGNQLEFAKFCTAVGKAIGEDTVLLGKSSGMDTREPGDIMFDGKST